MNYEDVTYGRMHKTIKSRAMIQNGSAQYVEL